MVAAALFAVAAAAQAAAGTAGLPAGFAYACHVVTGDGALHRAAIEVILPAGGTFRPAENREVQVIARSAEGPVFAGVSLPQTVTATDRSIDRAVPGYVQFGLTGDSASYIAALHAAEGSDLPTWFFVTRSDGSGRTRSWYWATGFCTRQPGQVQ